MVASGRIRLDFWVVGQFELDVLSTSLKDVVNQKRQYERHDKGDYGAPLNAANAIHPVCFSQRAHIAE